MPYSLKIIEAPTVLKTSPKQSSELEAGEMYRITDTSVTDEKAWSLKAFWEDATSNHVKFTLSAELGGRNTWWAYCPHVLVLGTEDGNNPKDEAKPDGRQTFITIPGISTPVALAQPIYKGSNFTWVEATKGTRIPVNKDVSSRIVQAAKKMDAIREYLGNIPLIVTSWYRPPEINAAVGGASRSQHITGAAVDFYSSQMSVVEIFNRLKPYHRDGGLAVGDGFVHVDWRGYACRWHYPGGPRVALW